MHLIFTAEGTQQGHRNIQLLARQGFPEGVTQLCEVRTYSLRFPKEYKGQIIQQFSQRTGSEFQHVDGASFKFKNRESPFKHAKFKKLIGIFIKLFGWVIGLKPINYNEATNMKYNQQLDARNIIPFAKLNEVNIFPICFVEDNVMHQLTSNKEVELL